MRDRQQSLALGREIRSRGVGTADNSGQMVERHVFDFMNSYDRVEGTAVADVSEFNVLDIVGIRARIFRYG